MTGFVGRRILPLLLSGFDGMRVAFTGFFPYLERMEVFFAPDRQAEIDRLVSETGCTPDKLVADVMAGYVAELAERREMLGGRYDDLN